MRAFSRAQDSGSLHITALVGVRSSLAVQCRVRVTIRPIYTFAREHRPDKPIMLSFRAPVGCARGRRRKPNAESSPPSRRPEIHKLQISYIFGISYSALPVSVSPRLLKQLVRMIGLEPTLPCGNWNLNPARLPISPHPHVFWNYNVASPSGATSGRPAGCAIGPHEIGRAHV